MADHRVLVPGVEPRPHSISLEPLELPRDTSVAPLTGQHEIPGTVDDRHEVSPLQDTREEVIDIGVVTDGLHGIRSEFF